MTVPPAQELAAQHRPSRPVALYMSVEGLDVTAGHELLRAGGVDVLELADSPAEDRLADVVALIAGYDPVGPELLDRLPALRMVATHSAGVDMVDLAALRERGLWLANLPAAATEEVAIHALSMALSLIRGLTGYDRDVRAGRWANEEAPLPRVPMELTRRFPSWVGLRVGRCRQDAVSRVTR